MMVLREDERDLLLSMYVDGELEGEQRAAVEQRLASDPAWQADYEALRAATQRISRVVESNWHDEAMTQKVRERVAARPAPSTATAAAAAKRLKAADTQTRQARIRAEARAQRVRWLGWFAAAAAMLLFAISLSFVLGGGTPQTPVAQAPAAPLGRYDAKAAQVSGADLKMERGVWAVGQRLQAGETQAWVALDDGSRLWLSPHGVLEGLASRSVKLLQGRVLIQVAPGRERFSVALEDGSTVEALGTRFEVALAENGPFVRVVEGHVRRHTDARSAEARGGQEIDPGFEVKPVDPRAVGARWPDAAPSEQSTASALAAPWSQVGGSPGHDGVSPLPGPLALAADAFYAYPKSESAEAGQYAPAVADARGRIFILRRADTERSRLFRLDLNAARPAWEPCGDAIHGHGQHHPPVVTPRGLVVLGVSKMTGSNVIAWDPETERVAWSADVGSSVYALACAPDGTLLASTFQRVAALDERDGRERWSYAAEGVTDLQAPACVLSDGQIVVATRAGRVVRLSPDGKLVREVRWSAAQGLFWPPVARTDGGVWLSAPDGGLANWGPDGKLEASTDGSVSTWPLGNGVLALGNRLGLPKGAAASLRGTSAVTAMALDGRGYLYAGAHAGVTRFKFDPAQDRAGETLAEDAFSLVQQGEIVRGGIAILPGRLVVTTTEGVQVFK